MNTLFYLIPLLLLGFTLYKVYKSQRKYLLELKLISLYDKIELHILKTRPHLSNNDIKFLKVNKNISVNPQFLDIEFIIAVNHIMKNKNIKVDTKWYTDYIKSEETELQNLLKEYTKTQIDYSLLTALKAKYILKGLWININNFISNKTISLTDLFRVKISTALYSGNNIGKLAGC